MLVVRRDVFGFLGRGAGDRVLAELGLQLDAQPVLQGHAVDLDRTQADAAGVGSGNARHDIHRIRRGVFDPKVQAFLQALEVLPVHGGVPAGFHIGAGPGVRRGR